MDYKIFLKKEPKKEKEENNICERKILSKSEIFASIPKDAKNEEDIDLSKIKNELRWRIFKIPNVENEIIEMSQKLPNKERLYMNQKGDWILYNDDGKYDKYIINKYYYYF
jgi:hypothetical protein